MAIFPKNTAAGVTFKAIASLPDYPAPGWSAHAYLRGSTQIDISGAAYGTDHLLQVTGTNTASWAAGLYSYSLRVTDGVDVFEVESGTIEITPNLATIATTYDGRSQAEIALAAINAVLAKRATLDQQRYTINNRELWRTPIPELIKLRSFYVAQVRREKRAKTGDNTFGRPINLRFTS